MSPATLTCGSMRAMGKIAPAGALSSTSISPKSASTGLSSLPFELLNIIISDLYHGSIDGLLSIKHLSLVSHTIRHLCIPFIFRKIVISFRHSSLSRLSSSSAYHFASIVREIRYQTPLFLDPKALDSSNFTRPFTSPRSSSKTRNRIPGTMPGARK